MYGRNAFDDLVGERATSLGTGLTGIKCNIGLTLYFMSFYPFNQTNRHVQYLVFIFLVTRVIWPRSHCKYCQIKYID